MLWISNKSDLFLFRDLVDKFFLLYTDPSNFPDQNEREEPIHIETRIGIGSNNPFTQLLIYQSKHPNKSVSGGAILEYYPISRCALLTYIFVHPNERGKGVARDILLNGQGLKKGIHLIEKKIKSRVNALFFETNNPECTMASIDSIDPIGRLQFFKKIGAKIIDIPYIQPPLDKHKEPVYNLLLLCLPRICNLADGFESIIFFEFYNEFCHSLNVKSSFYHKTEILAINYLLKRYNKSNKIFFKEIP